MGSKFLADEGFQGNDTQSYFIASLREGSKKKLPVLATVLREHNKIYSLYCTMKGSTNYRQNPLNFTMLPETS
jgi:hypothetical protein